MIVIRYSPVAVDIVMYAKVETEPGVMVWWLVKVVCNLVLLSGVFIHYLTDWYLPLLAAQYAVALGLVLGGGVVFLYHYYLIKRENNRLDVPGNLVTRGGLFTVIRHPMYFGEMFMFLGYVLMAPIAISLLCLPVAVFALVKQAQAEDRFLSRVHTERHACWCQSTRLLVPGIY